MAYNMPGSGVTQDPPVFEENANALQLYQGDGYPSEGQNSWIENVDPKLRFPAQIQLNQPPEPGLQNLQEPFQQFMTQSEGTLFTASPLRHHDQGLAQALNRPVTPISILPQAYHRRMTSPSPSQEQASTPCSSARSPGPDVDWYNEAHYSPMAQTQDDHPQSNGSWYIGNVFPDPWAVTPDVQAYHQPQGYSCLQNIQGLPDLNPDETTFYADEGFGGIESQSEYAVEGDSQHLKNGMSSSYPCPFDEGLGASIKDQSSPEASEYPHTQTQTGITSETDEDAEGEDDVELSTIGGISDTEYTPKSGSRKQRSSRNPALNTTKTGRVTKLTTPKPRGNRHICTLCMHTAKDAHGLQYHMATEHEHTRPFTCVFSFAGCASNFGSKNEWKRHVASQHLNLYSWICNMGNCSNSKRAKSASGSAQRGSEFNRKDLFTQHLKRMHTPPHLKHTNRKDKDWEARLKNLGKTCMVTNRKAPTRLGCPVPGCNVILQGNGAWDERMEHVGRHLDIASRDVDGQTVHQENDPLLIQWALTERIIEPNPGHAGSFRLVVGGGAATVDDEDAEGDDDDC